MPSWSARRSSTRSSPHQQGGLDYWADPFHRQPNAINTNDGGRSVYWDDPNGSILEIITRPYGSGRGRRATPAVDDRSDPTSRRA